MRRDPTDSDHLAALADYAAALGLPGQPRAGFDAIEAALGRLIGHKLFTLMVLDTKKGEAERLYSNRPDAYPVRGRKPMRAIVDPCAKKPPPVAGGGSDVVKRAAAL